MTTVYKTTVHYPNSKPDSGSPELDALYSQIDSIKSDLVFGPEVSYSDTGFVTIRKYTTLSSAQTYITAVNEVMANYELTTSIDQEEV